MMSNCSLCGIEAARCEAFFHVLSYSLLAHLSRRLIGELIIWQGCCLYVCLSTFSNVFFSKTAGPIEAKFHVEPPWDEGTKDCSRGSGHMTKMAAMTIYNKNPSKSFFSGTAGPISTKLGT